MRQQNLFDQTKERTVVEVEECNEVHISMYRNWNGNNMMCIKFGDDANIIEVIMTPERFKRFTLGINEAYTKNTNMVMVPSKDDVAEYIVNESLKQNVTN